MAVGIGVPILLAYIYGVVPFSLCRAGGCGLSTTPQGVRFEFDDENDALDLTSGARQPGGVGVGSLGSLGATWEVQCALQVVYNAEFSVSYSKEAMYPDALRDSSAETLRCVNFIAKLFTMHLRVP